MWQLLKVGIDDDESGDFFEVLLDELADPGVPEASYYVQDHLGNTRVVYKPIFCGVENASGEPIEYDVEYVGDYFPYAKTIREYVKGKKEKFLSTEHERDEETGLDYRGARFYDADIGRFLSLDPLAADYPSLSDYSYVAGNPIVFIDPDGRSIESTRVTANGDGTFTVVGGDAYDGDNGIYIDDGNGGNGEQIGVSGTPQSFYFSETEATPGSGDGEWLGTIDPGDQSGSNFLNNQIIAGNPSVIEYMAKATGGAPLDFKRTNGTNEVQFNVPEEFYRGMPIFASARDVGNIAAGLVAGRSGMGWSTARLGYDALESIQQGGFSSESTSTQYGQKLGHRIGHQMFQKYVQSRLPGNGHLRNVKISRDVIEQGDL